MTQPQIEFLDYLLDRVVILVVTALILRSFESVQTPWVEGYCCGYIGMLIRGMISQLRSEKKLASKVE